MNIAVDLHDDDLVYLSHHRLLVLYPWTAFSDLNCFPVLLCLSVCFISYRYLFLVSDPVW